MNTALLNPELQAQLGGMVKGSPSRYATVADALRAVSVRVPSRFINVIRRHVMSHYGNRWGDADADEATPFHLLWRDLQSGSPIRNLGDKGYAVLLEAFKDTP